MNHPTSLKAVVASALGVLVCASAFATLVDIQWNDRGVFERSATVAPGAFYELCGKLDRQASVAWRFESDRAMDFNIHFHEGKRVHYPTKQDATMSAEGMLNVERAEDYCWMWTNRSGSPSKLTVRLQR